MPKTTFFNLSDEKRKKIVKVLTEEFEKKNIQEATVKEIVQKLGIARGSFYQYFETLEESYFYILELKTGYLHKSFMNLWVKYGDIYDVLEEYGEKIVEIIFDKSCYNLYKNRYLLWNEKINRQWEEYKQKNMTNLIEVRNTDELLYISALMHSLISRSYIEKWDKDKFLEKYKKYVRWIREGVRDE